MNRLFTVTLTDLGTYEIIVAATGPKQALDIATTILFEEAITLPPGLRIVDRHAEGKAEPAGEAPVRQFEVLGSHTYDFLIQVPAANAEEAERHARRIYGAEPYPWEHSTGEDRVRWHSAQEVQP